MTDTKWTPGPWTLQREGATYIVIGANELGVAELHWCRWKTQFDAHLIAAAPELYEALAEMLRVCNLSPDSAPHRALALAALAKARGEQVQS